MHANNLLIYPREIQDGIDSLMLAKGNRVLCNALPSAVDIQNDKILQAVAAQELQPDLYYMNSILVTTNWNLNDDVFIPSHTWAARFSPEDKPLNIEHKALDIIGHQTGNVAVDDAMNIIPDNTPISALPNKFHIVINSVIYTRLDDEAKQKEISRIIAEMARSKWYISMECYFSDFDYALISKENFEEAKAKNEFEVVERTKSTAFLTKYLRIYNGPGVYDKYRVGRVLKNIVFAGAAVVESPANPESIILNKTVGEYMTLEELQAQLDAKIAALNEVEEKYKASVQRIAAKESKINELQAELDANQRMEFVKTELGVDDAQAKNIVSLCVKFDQEEFNKHVAAFKAFKPAAAANKGAANTDVAALDKPNMTPGYDGNVPASHTQANIIAQLDEDVATFMGFKGEGK